MCSLRKWLRFQVLPMLHLNLPTINYPAERQGYFSAPTPLNPQPIISPECHKLATRAQKPACQSDSLTRRNGHLNMCRPPRTNFPKLGCLLVYYANSGKTLSHTCCSATATDAASPRLSFGYLHVQIRPRTGELRAFQCANRGPPR